MDGLFSLRRLVEVGCAIFMYVKVNVEKDMVKDYFELILHTANEKIGDSSFVGTTKRNSLTLVKNLTPPNFILAHMYINHTKMKDN